MGGARSNAAMDTVPAVQHIHIVGASGSGTSTLGAALLGECGYAHIDTDDYYWQPTDPPFQHPRDRTARQTLLGAALDASPRWVLTGVCVDGGISSSRASTWSSFFWCRPR